ncbi:MAG: hypothetical protein VKO00_04675 [Cyanobacteriota bacterium]|nr:hypothetical protein [Cyanobacteriota bacterium]
MTNQAPIDLNEESKTTDQNKNRQERKLVLAQSPDSADLKAIHQPASGGSSNRRGQGRGSLRDGTGNIGGQLLGAINEGGCGPAGLLPQLLSPNGQIKAEEEYADQGGNPPDGIEK